MACVTPKPPPLKIQKFPRVGRGKGSEGRAEKGTEPVCLLLLPRCWPRLLAVHSADLSDANLVGRTYCNLVHCGRSSDLCKLPEWSAKASWILTDTVFDVLWSWDRRGECGMEGISGFRAPRGARTCFLLWTPTHRPSFPFWWPGSKADRDPLGWEVGLS